MTRQIGCCKLCYCCGLANTADAENDDAAAFREFIPLGNTSVYVYDVFRDVGLLLPSCRSTAKWTEKRQFHHAFLHGLRVRIGGCLRPYFNMFLELAALMLFEPPSFGRRAFLGLRDILLVPSSPHACAIACKNAQIELKSKPKSGGSGGNATEVMKGEREKNGDNIYERRTSFSLALWQKDCS